VSMRTPPATGPLVRLARTRPAAAFLAALALVLAGLLVPGTTGAVILLALVAALATLAVRTWPVTVARTRLVRAVVLAGLLAVALAKLA